VMTVTFSLMESSAKTTTCLTLTLRTRTSASQTSRATPSSTSSPTLTSSPTTTPTKTPSTLLAMIRLLRIYAISPFPKEGKRFRSSLPHWYSNFWIF
jgi:hypothetical protein